jgi:hypothetical protein
MISTAASPMISGLPDNVTRPSPSGIFATADVAL